MTKHELGRLVVTIDAGEDGECLELLAHTPDGPVPVWLEVAAAKACRCGGQSRRVRVRFVGPKCVRVKRTPRKGIPR